MKKPTEKKPTVTLPGTVEQIISAIAPDVPEKAQISVHGAEDLYREIRIENKLENSDGDGVELKLGANVEVTIEAESEQTTSKTKDQK